MSAESTERSELQFLLELVNCQDYRSKLTNIKKVGSADLRDVSCDALLAKGYIECNKNKKIDRFVIADPGKDLLKREPKACLSI